MTPLRKLSGCLLAAAAAALIIAAPGCTTTPAAPGTVQLDAAGQAKVAISVAISAVKAVRTVGDQLLLAKTINAAEAQRIQDQCNQARALLVTARGLLATGSTVDLSTAQGKLLAAQALLASANEFFATKGYDG